MEPGKTPLPGEPRFGPEIYRRFNDLETFDDFFEIEAIVPLTHGADAILSNMTDAIYHDHHWFILDRLAPAIFKFTDSGKFVLKFGVGEGPGALTDPWSLRPVFDGHLGVADLEQGRILVFDGQGKFITATDPMIEGHAILSQFAYIWDRADQLYLASFPSANPDAPQHLALDYSQAKGKILFGFGEQIQSVARARQKGSGAKPYTAFNRLGNYIWAGSPYTTYLNIYDLQGHACGEIGKETPRITGAMVLPEDLEHLSRDPESYMQVIAQKSSNTKIGALGPVVLVQMGQFLDFYDMSGNLLKANLPFQPTSYLFLTNNRLAMAVSAEALGANINPELRSALQSMPSHDGPPTLHLVVYDLRSNLLQ